MPTADRAPTPNPNPNPNENENESPGVDTRPVGDNRRMLEQTIRGGVGAQIEVAVEAKHSRFVCTIVRVETETAARDAIDEARRARWNARHHCCAFVLGSATAPDQVRRSNDDGEPSGTAGRPILDVLSGRNLIDCVAVVSRYFGGTLLGTGGLIRAYATAATSAIDELEAANRLVLRQRRQLFRLSLPHADAGRVEAELRVHGVLVLGTHYGETAVVTLASELSGGAELAALVAGITAGERVLEPAGAEWADAAPPPVT